MQDENENTISINLVIRTAHPYKVMERKNEHNNNKGDDRQEHTPQDPTKFASKLSIISSDTSRHQRGLAKLYAGMCIPKTMTPPSRLKTSADTSVTRIGDRCSDSSRQERRNEKCRSHDGQKLTSNT